MSRRWPVRQGTGLGSRRDKEQQRTQLGFFVTICFLFCFFPVHEKNLPNALKSKNNIVLTLLLLCFAYSTYPLQENHEDATFYSSKIIQPSVSCFLNV